MEDTHRQTHTGGHTQADTHRQHRAHRCRSPSTWMWRVCVRVVDLSHTDTRAQHNPVITFMHDHNVTQTLSTSKNEHHTDAQARKHSWDLKVTDNASSAVTHTHTQTPCECQSYIINMGACSDNESSGAGYHLGEMGWSSSSGLFALPQLGTCRVSASVETRGEETALVLCSAQLHVLGIICVSPGREIRKIDINLVCHVEYKPEAGRQLA